MHIQKSGLFDSVFKCTLDSKKQVVDISICWLQLCSQEAVALMAGIGVEVEVDYRYYYPCQMMRRTTNLFCLCVLRDTRKTLFHVCSKNIGIPMVAVDSIDNDSDDVLISKTCGYGNAASCCLDEKTDLDIQDINSESSFRLYGYDDVLPNGHLQ